VPSPGATLRIDDGTRLARGAYVLPAPGPDGALLLEGLVGVTLDLTGVELRGALAGADLDTHTGRGIVVRGCRDVTLRGGTIGGYKACVVVADSQRITLEGMRFEGWYGMRLRSTSALEDAADWLRPHENDAGEWTETYGAAISITGGAGHVVRRCRGRHGQNGVLLTRVEDTEVYDNDFSFLSGWGLALYRASENVVSHNWFDYNVRGYSHDVYWRGQDSAGILLFERCGRNLVAYNSATHCGDGVFLYAGQDLVEGRAAARGERDVPGSDGNLFIGNDLRFAVANGLEATFSTDNVLIGNDLSGCRQHGVWGGYSRRLLLQENRISDTKGSAITIEHGQECWIVGNELSGNERSVELYWDEDPELVGGPLGKQRDTASRDHWIVDNRFHDNVQDLVLSRTTGIVVHGNTWLPGNREAYIEDLTAADDPARGEATVRAWLNDLTGKAPSGNLRANTMNPWKGDLPDVVQAFANWTPPTVPGTFEPRAEERGVAFGGLETIVLGEFGPWDFRSGEPRPTMRRTGGLLADSRWNVTWFRWDAARSDPRTNEAAWRAGASTPLHTAEVPNLINPWGGSEVVKRAVGNTTFGLLATTTLQLERRGAYRLRVVSDDGVRVKVDGETVFEDWTHHAPEQAVVSLALAPGEHTVEVEYFQIQGAAALVVELERE